MSISTWTAARSPTARVSWLGNAVTLAPPEELGSALDMLGKMGKRVLIETSTAPLLGGDPPAGRGRDAGARRRSGRAAQGLQERRRAGRHPRRASPRRRRGQPLPELARRQVEAPASCARSRCRTGCRRCARRPASCAISASTRFPAPAPTAPSSTTAPPRRRNARSNRAASTWSTPAASIATAPPTSPAPSPSARPHPRCATASRAC